MSRHDRQMQPNGADVAAKVIDGEAIIMNLSSGAYYSMAGTGATVWTLIEQGLSLSTIGATLANAYQTPLETVLADLEQLADQLLRENLVHEVAAGTDPGGPTWVPVVVDGPYATPMLNKYTDMQDLLALDPPMPSISQIGGKAAVGG